MIAELTWPGGWIAYEDEQKAFELQSLLYPLTSSLNDLSLALILFQAARSRSAGRHRARFADQPELGKEDESWARKRAIEDGLLADAEATAAAMAPDELWDLRNRVRVEAEIQWKREKWSRGELPTSLLDQEAAMHARSFVYGIDGVWKILKVFTKSPVPNEAQVAWEELERCVPDLIGVRNTAHHQEDRARGLAQGGKPLPRPPIDNSLVKAPGGGVVMLNVLNGDRYTCTLSDGSIGEVPVNVETLRAVERAAQQTLDSMAWTGSPMHFPTDL